MDNQNKSKKDFLLGLVSGIAILAVIGFVVVLGMYFNKDKDLLTADLPGGNNTNTEGNQKEAQIKVAQDDNVRGNFEAPVTIVEFSDFQCSFCGRFHPTLQRILDDYPDQIRWVYKHFPLDQIHPQARPAAEASECAAEQGKFWEFADGLFENQTRFGESFYQELATQLGLNMSEFEDCVSLRKYQDKVESDLQEGIKAGVGGTPNSFINGQSIPGAASYEQIKSVVESILSD